MNGLKLLAGTVLAVLFAGCSGPSATGSSEVTRSLLPAARSHGTQLGTYIQHVVIVVQENRSFDNIFAGFPGADSHTYGYMHNGTELPLRPITFASADQPHDWKSANVSVDQGKMDGFDLATDLYTPSNPPAGQYAYLERSLVAPYWAMAKQYVLADHMFPTELSDSFTAHLNLIASTANISPTLAEVNVPSAQPWGCDAPVGTTTSTVNQGGAVSTSGPFPCFTQFSTLADTLDAAGVSWKYYSPTVGVGGGNWSSFQAIKNVRYGADWSSKVVSPETNVLSDVANGNLPSVSWVVPDLLFSDHAGLGAGSQHDSGPSWVAAVVNAVGQSKYWNSTAIIVLWDDWGGWYDDVPPPKLGFAGLGIRVPCIVISPYGKPHHVSHTQYEFGSVVKFVEQTFNLPPLGATSFGYSDTRANSMVDAFDFTQLPRTFTPFTAKYPPSFFINYPGSRKAPDND